MFLKRRRGRVVKASDLKSDSFWERRFEPCRLRFLSLLTLYARKVKKSSSLPFVSMSANEQIVRVKETRESERSYQETFAERREVCVVRSSQVLTCYQEMLR